MMPTAVNDRTRDGADGSENPCQRPTMVTS